jgi:hypothetical protein
MAGNTPKRLPRLATGMPIGAEVATAEPAVIGAIWSRTEVRVRVDSPSATSGERDHGRWRAGRLASCIGHPLTGCAERFVDEPSEGFRLFGAFTPGLVGLEGPVRWGRV